MNATEARIIMTKYFHASYPADLTAKAKGYLSALEGPEVKALVDALEQVDALHDASMSSAQTRRVARYNTLVAYRKAVQK